MNEILPGLFHWTAVHPNLGMEVSCHYAESEGVVFDPLEPAEGLDWFRARDTEPKKIVLSTRHHLRHAERFAEAFGAPILSSRPGMHDFEDGPDVTPFDFDQEVAPGIGAIGPMGISPDDTALVIGSAHAVLIADAVVNYGEIGFVPERYLSDDPEQDKRNIVEALRELLERNFDNLLFAHGEPIVGGGKEALTAFVESR